MDSRLDALDTAALEPARAAALNEELQALDRDLVLVNFTANGPFDQDLALPVPPVPLLEPAERLTKLAPASDEAHFLATELVRNRNKAAFHLRLGEEAGARAEAILTRASGG